MTNYCFNHLTHTHTYASIVLSINRRAMLLLLLTVSSLAMSFDGGRSILKIAKPRRSADSSSLSWATCCLMPLMISNAFAHAMWLANGPLARNSSSRAVTSLLKSSLDDNRPVLNLSWTHTRTRARTHTHRDTDDMDALVHTLKTQQLWQVELI